MTRKDRAVVNRFVLAKPFRGPTEDVLANGCYIALDTEDGFVYARTGPFVPPFAFPSTNELVVTDEVRTQLLTKNDVKATYDPVGEIKWVHSPWSGERLDTFVEDRKLGLTGFDLLATGEADSGLAEDMPCLWRVQPFAELVASYVNQGGCEFDGVVLDESEERCSAAGDLFTIRIPGRFGRYFVITESLWVGLSAFQPEEWCARYFLPSK